MSQRHEYLHRLLLARDLGIIDSGSAARAVVVHEDGCPIVAGSFCECDPEIRIDCADGRAVYIGEEGLAAVRFAEPKP